MVFIRASIWLALVLPSQRLVSAVISTETHRNQRQEVVVDAQASVEMTKPAATHQSHHKKKSKQHDDNKISDVAEPVKEATTKKQKAKHKKMAKPASLLRSEPATDPEDSSDEEKPEEEDKGEEGKAPEEDSQAESTEPESEDTQGEAADDKAASAESEKAPEEAEAKESADDMQAEEAATAEDNGNDGNDGTDTATEAMAISDGPSRRIYQNSNATATVLESDAASSAATKANSSQTALHSVEDSSGSAGEQGLAEAADAQSVAELSAENTEGLEEGSDEAESEELNRGAAQACIGTMIEKCPSDKTDACKTKDAGTCVNVFHKCKDDRMVQCAVRQGKCASGGATCYLPCTGVELHGSSCAALPVDNCNGGYVSDGSSGMACMISTADITKCTNAGTCALPEKE